jgi:hypothetical protein
VLAGVALAVAAVGTGAAYAASNAPAKAAPIKSAPLQAPPPAPAATAADPSPTTDGDTVQQGDQTTPDVAGEAPESGSEAPDSATETGAETETNDGPGGHADPPGTVDHQFEGAE